MSATEELRRLLDERGVEWDEYGDGYTLFQRGGREYTVQPNVCNRLIVTNLTTEQAIAATLGPGTCQQEEGGWSTEGDHARVWLTCGHDCMVETVADLPNFCPECGAKVVTE